jgi:hemoglobin
METRRQTVYQMIGGEEALSRLVERFYDIIETDPDGAIVHALHLQGFGIGHVRIAQFQFLSGFFGGPQYYVETMGHANLRAMHEHIQIGPAEADGYRRCRIQRGCESETDDGFYTLGDGAQKQIVTRHRQPLSSDRGGRHCWVAGSLA